MPINFNKEITCVSEQPCTVAREYVFLSYDGYKSFTVIQASPNSCMPITTCKERERVSRHHSLRGSYLL